MRVATFSILISQERFNKVSGLMIFSSNPKFSEVTIKPFKDNNSISSFIEELDYIPYENDEGYAYYLNIKPS